MQGGNKGSITSKYSGIGLLILMGLPAEWLHSNEVLALLPGRDEVEEKRPFHSRLSITDLGITLAMPIKVDCLYLIGSTCVI